jgi:hypothetical protein
MDLSIPNSFQTAVPNSTVNYQYTLTNTIGTDLPITIFVGLNLPSYLTEQFVPFTLLANSTVNGTLSFQVAANPTPGLQIFAMEAASSLHDPDTGLSYVSNMVPLSVQAVPEPSTALLFAIGLTGAIFLVRTWPVALTARHSD